MDPLTKTIRRLPKVLQKEIWEYVRGDRAFWMSKRSAIQSHLKAYFLLNPRVIDQDSSEPKSCLSRLTNKVSQWLEEHLLDSWIRDFFQFT